MKSSQGQNRYGAMKEEEASEAYERRKKELQDRLTKMKSEYHKGQKKKSPKKVENSQRSKRSSSIKKGEELYKKAKIKEQSRASRSRESQKLRNDKETRECSFSPSLNRNSLQMAEKKYAPLATKSRNVIQERRQKEQDFKKQKELEALKGCTFHPKISQPSNHSPSKNSFYQRNIEWKKKVEQERDVKSAKAYSELMRRPKSPGSPTASHGSSFDFSVKSYNNKNRPSSRDPNSELLNRNSTEKSNYKGSFNRDSSFHSSKSKRSLDSRKSISNSNKMLKAKPENLLTSMEDSMNKIQSLSKRLNSLQGTSHGKHQLFTDKKKSEMVNLYSKTSSKKIGRAEINDPGLMRNRTVKSGLNKRDSKENPPYSFKKTNSPTKSISSLNSASSKKFSKNYFSPSKSARTQQNNPLVLMNNLKTLKTNK